MSRRTSVLAVLVACGTVLFSVQGCVGDDPAASPIQPDASAVREGELGQPCRPDGACITGLVCDRGICLEQGDASVKDASLVEGSARFDPATLPLTGWWRAPYGGSPWQGDVGGSLAEATDAPAPATAVNGHAPAKFDGVNDQLSTSADWNTYVSGSAGTVLVLFQADSAVPAAADAYDDPSILSDTSYGFSLGFSDQGLGVAFYDTDWRQLPRIKCPTGTWHLAKVRWDGTMVEYGVDGSPMTRVATGPLSMVATTKLRIGTVLISKEAHLDGRVLEIMLAKAVLGDADIGKVSSYFASRYGLSL